MSISIIEIFAQLKATSSTNEKKQILADNASPLLQQVLWLSNAPYHSFNGRKLPEVTIACQYNEGYVAGLLERAVHEPSMRDAILREMAYQCSDEIHVNFWNSVIAKDVDCGMGATLINSVFPDLIPVFDVAKAEDETQLAKMTAPYYVEDKIDGSRCTCIYNGTEVLILSSSGRAYPNMQHLKDSVMDAATHFPLDEHNNFTPFVIDSELVFTDEDGNVLPRATSNGLANKALNGNLSAEQELRAKVIAFDMLTMDEFEGKVPARPLLERKEMVSYLAPIPHIDALVGEVYQTLEEVMVAYRKVVDLGGEGVMVKEINSGYQRKRMKEWVKIKKEFEIDLKIIGIKPHKKHDWMIGSLELECGDSIINGSVGTKMSDEMRAHLQRLHDTGRLIGGICTVMVHEITTKKGKKGQPPTYSLYLPRFIELRNDKLEADSFEKVLRITKQVDLIV